jgi:ABC-type transport system involved in cytochrome c biogenesis permease subunit
MHKLNLIKLIISLSIVLLAGTTQAKEPTQTYFCQQYLESMPIQQGGRVKPLMVHSKEMIKYLTGKTKWDNLSATQLYCLLSLQDMGMKSTINLTAQVDHVELKKLLELKNGSNRIAFTDIPDYENQMRVASVKNREETSYGKALRKLKNQLNLYNDIKSGNNWILPQMNGEQVSWVPVSSFLREEEIARRKNAGDTNPFKSLFVDSKAQYEKYYGNIHGAEYRMEKMRLTSFAMLFAIIAIALLIGVKNTLYGLIAAGSTVLLQTIYIGFRVYISGRAPITNMYETVLFSGYGALILSMIITAYRKEKLFMIIGLAYNVLTLMMLHFSGGMLNPAISPLVPVLRDNFWLSTHVTTVILSYGAYALSWILANYVLVKNKFGGVSNKDLNYYVDLMYTCLKYGSIMLAAGLLLGGAWADYSWGRFWGWDPKETWSLIVLCFYMAILHGKYTSWITNRLFVPLTALCFLSVMMAWFGVNYILASGLHSYGFSEGGAIFLGTFFAVQILIVAIFGKSFFIMPKKEEAQPNEPTASAT